MNEQPLRTEGKGHRGVGGGVGGNTGLAVRKLSRKKGKAAVADVVEVGC